MIKSHNVLKSPQNQSRNSLLLLELKSINTPDTIIKLIIRIEEIPNVSLTNKSPINSSLLSKLSAFTFLSSKLFKIL